MSKYLTIAEKFSKMAHAGQRDKGGASYYLHPKTVASMCETEDEKIVAYLHDVVEETKYTIEDIKKLGFNKKVIEGIKYMTHDKSTSYDDYIKKIKTCDLARKVKINDLKNNMDLSRLKEVTEKDKERVKKYQYYYNYLNN